MQKKIGSVILIAGTCIGSGMIALPMVLAKLGLIPSIILMLSIWILTYYTSLINIELNLQAGKGMSIGELGQHFSGKIAGLFGFSSLKILSYALLAVFIYGGSSVLKKLFGGGISMNIISTGYAFIVILILLLPVKILDYINRFLFAALLGITAILIAGLFSMIDWSNMPLFAENYQDLSLWRVVAPVVFTSFGFQVIFHTVTNYCNKDAKVLKKAFFWGSLIPAIVYIIWTCGVLSVVYNKNPDFYHQMVIGDVEVGDLVAKLSSIAKWQAVQLLVWWISFFAIVTSVLGVGMGLCDSLRSMLDAIIPNKTLRRIAASLITILPAYIVAMLIPNAFIMVLGFAGMILVIISILLPSYLFYVGKIKNLNYKILRYKSVIALAVIIGVAVISCELANMIIHRLS
jgi:tyrosine-specific transport protein